MKRNDTTDGLLDGAEVDWDAVSGSRPPLGTGGYRTAELRGTRGSDERENQ